MIGGWYKVLLFAGLDPGTTVGYCVLNIRGEIVGFNSAKYLSINILIRRLSDLGRVVAIGTDKAKVPYMVKTVATKFGSVISSPKEDISVNEKIVAARIADYRNSHERDAIASALFAYSTYSRRLKELNAFLESNDLVSEADFFIETALKRPNLPYNSILEMMAESRRVDLDKGAMDPVAHSGIQVEDKKISSTNDGKIEEQSNLKTVLKSISRHNQILQAENGSLRKELDRLSSAHQRLSDKMITSPLKRTEKELMEMIGFKERRLQSYISRLANIESEKSMLNAQMARLIASLSTDDGMLVDFLPSLSKLESMDSKGRQVRNKIFFIDDVNIYTDGSLEILDRYGLILLSPKKLNSILRKKVNATIIEWDRRYERIADKVLISKSDLGAKIDKSGSLDYVLDEYQQMRRKELLG